MFDHHTPEQKDRSLEKALSNNLVDRCFSESEGWLRAILRMCIFSITYTERQAALLIECPNATVARRLSHQSEPLQKVMQWIRGRPRASKRVLLCYYDDYQRTWWCFDTKKSAWKNLKTR